MTGGGDGDGTASLRALDLTLASLRRLLDRRGADGALLRADPALIEAAIAAARRDLCAVRDLLAAIPGDASDPCRAAAGVMAEAVADLDAVLDVFTGAVGSGG